MGVHATPPAVLHLSFDDVQAVLQDLWAPAKDGQPLPERPRLQCFVRKFDGRTWPSPLFSGALAMEKIFGGNDDLTLVWGACAHMCSSVQPMHH